MDSDYDSVIGVYSEAKSEYSRQLTLFILPVVTKFFFRLLDATKEEEPDSKKHIWAFQNKLSQIPEWNQDKVIKETNKIQSDSGCDYLEELLTAVFIAHTKVLSSIRLNNRQKKLQISIPKVDHFLHRTLTECSRVLWSSAYLFHENINPIDKQKNLEKINSLIGECIIQAVRSMLPVKNILREYLSEEPEVDMKKVPGGFAELAEPAESAESSEPAEPVEPAEPAEPVKTAEPVKPMETLEIVDAVKPVGPPEVPEVPEPVETKTVSLPSILKKTPVENIIVDDTEPSVHFAEYNTVFSNGASNSEKLHQEDDGLIKFDDNDSPVDITEFEDLENNEVVPIDDFEEL